MHRFNILISLYRGAVYGKTLARLANQQCACGKSCLHQWRLSQRLPPLGSSCRRFNMAAACAGRASVAVSAKPFAAASPPLPASRLPHNAIMEPKYRCLLLSCSGRARARQRQQCGPAAAGQ